MERTPRPGRLRLLHVGRAVRTKGLRDAVRALAHLADLPGVTLTSAGTGEDLAACREEADRLGVAHRVTFLGRVPRAEVERLYATHDAFCFPSFREPAGNVLYEAMRHGLPVITADRGGPAWIVDETCGIRVPVTDPDCFPVDIAAAVRGIALSPELAQRMGQGARDKVAREGLWTAKADRMLALYEELAAPSRRAANAPKG
jgi:glycosyltransferase involved in cell wall biosynthesis